VGRRLGAGCLAAAALVGLAAGCSPGIRYGFTNGCDVPIVVQPRNVTPFNLRPGEYGEFGTNDREPDERLWMVRRQDGSGSEVRFRLEEPRGSGWEVYFRIEGDRCPIDEPGG
jgi:hypothetical protein